MSAKIRGHERDRLLFAIAPLDTLERRERYKASVKAADLAKRYRWDLYWLAFDNGFRFDSDDYTDAHIDTALRNIVVDF